MAASSSVRSAPKRSRSIAIPFLVILSSAIAAFTWIASVGSHDHLPLHAHDRSRWLCGKHSEKEPRCDGILHCVLEESDIHVGPGFVSDFIEPVAVLVFLEDDAEMFLAGVFKPWNYVAITLGQRNQSGK